MQEKILEEIIFSRIHVGLVFALARLQENIFEDFCNMYNTIRAFPNNMYSHLRPLCLYAYSGCIHTPLMPTHQNSLGELISVRIHAAHAFAPRRIQETITGKLIMYWFFAMVYFHAFSACVLPLLRRDNSPEIPPLIHHKFPREKPTH